MRLLQLVTAAEELLDLHPQLTVVRGLDDATRARLTDVVRGLARHDVTGEGLLEAHGILFDLDAGLLALLDSRQPDIDPVVRPEHLPGAVGEGDTTLREREGQFAALLEELSTAVQAHASALEAAGEAEAAAAQAREALEEAQLAVEPSSPAPTLPADGSTAETDALSAVLRDAAASSAVAREERELAEERVVAAGVALLAIEAQHDALRREAGAIRDRLDEGSLAAVAVATEALRALEASTVEDDDRGAPEAPALDGTADVAASDGRGAASAVDRSDLLRQLAVLDGLLEILDATDPEPVQAALLELSLEAELVPSARAHALADALAQVDAQLAAADAAGIPDVTTEDVEAVRERLDRARIELHEAEDTARAHQLAPTDAVALEAAHEALLDAMDRADARFSGTRARARAEQLREDEQEILDRLGFLSYSEYLMGTSAAHRDPRAEAALEVAKAELLDAEMAWEDMEERRLSTLALAERMEERRRLREEARQVLDRAVTDWEVAVGELRGHQEPAVSQAERSRTLRRSLEGVGLDLGEEDLDADELVLVAEAWLEEVAAADERRDEHLDARAGILRSLDELDAGAASTVAGAPGDSSLDQAGEGLDDPIAVIEAARATLDAAEARRSAHDQAIRALDEAAADLARLEAELAAAERQLHEAQERLRAAEAADAAAIAQLEAAEEALAQSTPVPVGTPDASDVSDAVGLAALVAALEEAEGGYRAAADELERLTTELAALERGGEAAAREIEALQDQVAARSQEGDAIASEVEWYLMARVAAQRSMSAGGSTPLLLDDALRGLSDDDVHHLLGRLQRVADTVQIIVVSDDAAAAEWADAAGEQRAAVVSPVAV